MSNVISKPIFFSKNFENVSVLRDIDSIFLKNRGYNFKIPKPGSSVILIVSGGLDSTMLWFHLLHKYKLHVYPVFFTSPFLNKHYVPGEYLSLSYFSNYLKSRFPECFHSVKFIPLDLSFSLTNNQNIQILNKNWRLALSNARINSVGHKSIYLLDYPTRFIRYVLSAFEYGLSLQAEGKDVATLFLGVVPNDSQIGRESTLTVLRSLNLYLCLLLGDWRWQITGPVEKRNRFFYSKEDSILIGNKYKIPLEKTWSCVRQLPLHCGFCNACRYRHESFLSAKVVDRTTYIVPPQIKVKLKQIYLAIKALISGNRRYSSIPAQKTKHRQPWQTKPELNRKTFVRLSASAETFKTGTVFFIRNNKTEEVVTLNSIGQEVIMHIEGKGGLTISSLVKKIKNKYPKTAQLKIAEDIVSFIHSLVRGGYLEIKAR